jgi:uncharacterized MnhB-related membrane protein
MKDGMYRAIKYALTFTIFFGMIYSVMQKQVLAALVIFGAGFAILQIVNVKYKKELESEQR